MFDWRKMTLEERSQTLADRQKRNRPWHSPPHRYLPGMRRYSISAACYEHAPTIAYTADRMDEFAQALLHICRTHSKKVSAWCVLPDHYHVVLTSEDLRGLLNSIGLLHGRTSHAWNGEEEQRGRRVWCNYIDREMRSDGHFNASIHYVLHNPVKHKYVEQWQDWPWSNATEYLAQFNRETAVELWKEYSTAEWVEEVALPF